MSRILFIIVISLISSLTASEVIKIKNVCQWYHEEILGWHQNYLLFRNRHLEVSDKSKYPDIDDKTIRKKIEGQICPKMTRKVTKRRKVTVKKGPGRPLGSRNSYKRTRMTKLEASLKQKRSLNNKNKKKQKKNKSKKSRA